MSLQLQQLDPLHQVTGRKVTVSVSEVLLKTNHALLLVLVLIIPTLNGVTLIA